VAAALLSAMEDLARLHGCSAIHTRLAERAGASEGLLLSCLRSNGHRLAGLHLTKTLG
jgi:hypothetical protein